jgi:hypothetical protein
MVGQPDPEWEPFLPKPTARYRRRAWREFERAIDPLGTPPSLSTKLAQVSRRLRRSARRSGE